MPGFTLLLLRGGRPFHNNLAFRAQPAELGIHPKHESQKHLSALAPFEGAAQTSAAGSSLLRPIICNFFCILALRMHSISPVKPHNVFAQFYDALAGQHKLGSLIARAGNHGFEAGSASFYFFPQPNAECLILTRPECWEVVGMLVVGECECWG